MCNTQRLVLAALAAVLVLTPVVAAAQSSPDIPRTAWGDPDIGGVWDYSSITPMQRPEKYGDREFLTAEEVAGKCCNFESGDGSRFGIEVSCRHLEQPVDELNLAPHIRAAHPPRLPLPNHVHGLVSLDCPPRRVKLAKPLFGLYPSFDRSMVLLQDIVQVLDRPMAAATAQGAFLFHGWNRRAVEAGLIGVDDAGLRMRWIAERLAKQPFGRRSIAER